MRNKLKWTLGLVFLSLFWNACTVQKCIYRRGFNIDFKGFNGTKKSNESAARQVQLSNVFENEATAEDTEVLNVLVPQDPTQMLALNQVKSNDVSEKGLAPIKPVINFDETKRSIAFRATKSIAQSNVLSHVNAAPLAPDWLILLLCIFIPPIAVALMSNGNIEKILIALLLWILGILPGIVYAFLVYLHYL